MKKAIDKNIIKISEKEVNKNENKTIFRFR